MTLSDELAKFSRDMYRISRGTAVIGIQIRADLQAGRLDDWQRRTGRKHPASRANA